MQSAMEAAKMTDPRVRKWKTIYPAYIDSAKTIDQGTKTFTTFFNLP